MFKRILHKKAKILLGKYLTVASQTSIRDGYHKIMMSAKAATLSFLPANGDQGT